MTLIARSLGPVASRVLGRLETALSVHSVFPSTLNLHVVGSPILVALTGPAGLIHPHAVALDRDISFPSLGLAVEDAGRREGDRIVFGSGGLDVDLLAALRLPRRELPRTGSPGGSWKAAVARLALLQSRLGCELRIDGLLKCREERGGLPEALHQAARALGAAALRHGSTRHESLPLAVIALLGLGQGLTPTGDDFLSGFLAASRASGREGLFSSLGEAIATNSWRTGEISASLLRCAAEGHWPGPLADLAEVLAGSNGAESLDSLEKLCALGHSSGADLATGFLYGLAVLVRLPVPSPV